MDDLSFFYACADIKKGEADMETLRAAKAYAEDSLPEMRNLLDDILEWYGKLRSALDLSKEAGRNLFRQNMNLISRAHAKEAGHEST